MRRPANAVAYQPYGEEGVLTYDIDVGQSTGLLASRLHRAETVWRTVDRAPPAPLPQGARGLIQELLVADARQCGPSVMGISMPRTQPLAALRERVPPLGGG